MADTDTTDTIYRLPCFGIVLVLNNHNGLLGGSITSDLHEGACTCGSCPSCYYNITMDGIEALILGHACAGIDITTPAYIEGIESAVQGAANNI